MKTEKRLDKTIMALEELMNRMVEEDPSKLKELSDIHAKLVDTRNVQRMYGINPTDVFKGVLGIATILLILNYEKADIITSKGYDIAKRMIGG